MSRDEILDSIKKGESLPPIKDSTKDSEKGTTTETRLFIPENGLHLMRYSESPIKKSKDN